MTNFSANAPSFYPRGAEHCSITGKEITIPVSQVNAQYAGWQRKLEGAKRRGDSLAHMRKAIHKKMKIQAEEHEAEMVKMRCKLLKKEEQVDRLLAAGKDAALVARQLEEENEGLRASAVNLEDTLFAVNHELDYYRRQTSIDRACP